MSYVRSFFFLYPGLVQLWWAGLPLRSWWTIGAPSVQGAIPMSIFRFSYQVTVVGFEPPTFWLPGRRFTTRPPDHPAPWSFGRVRNTSRDQLHMRTSPKLTVRAFGRVGKTRDISLSIQLSLWFSTTLRYSPLLPVSVQPRLPILRSFPTRRVTTTATQGWTSECVSEWVSECWMFFYAAPTSRVIFTAKTSLDLFSLGRKTGFDFFSLGWFNLWLRWGASL